MSTNEEVEAAKQRVAEWITEIRSALEEKREADASVDASSLQRAADLEAIYQSFGWVQDMPPLVRKKRGPKPDPKSRDQFAKWLKQTFGWGTPQRVSQLHFAYELVPKLIHLGGGVSPTGEKSIRPFERLRKAGYEAQQEQVWQQAVEAAGGQPPTPAQVSAAVKKFLDDHKPPAAKKNVAKDPRTTAEIEAAEIQRRINEFDEFMKSNNRAATKALQAMMDHHKAYQAEVRQLRETELSVVSA